MVHCFGLLALVGWVLRLEQPLACRTHAPLPARPNLHRKAHPLLLPSLRAFSTLWLHRMQEGSAPGNIRQSESFDAACCGC
jgi:hypothetical protein